MKKLLLLILLCVSCSFTLSAKNFFTDEVKPRRLHLLLDAGVGGDFYRSHLSPLYATDQWVEEASLTLGYKIDPRWFTGLGVGFRHCTNDQKTSFPLAGSFPAFAMARYTFSDVRLKPYAEVRGGVVVYPKWNSFIKPHAAIGGGIHVLPRLSVGGKCLWYGTLDNRYSFELQFSVGFVL